MAESTAAIAYGVCVRTCDLVAAGEAYARLSPVLIALDLLTARRAAGTLRTSLGVTGGALERVPGEVWEMIKQAMIDAEVHAARCAIQSEWACEECAEIQAGIWAIELNGDERHQWDLSPLRRHMIARVQEKQKDYLLSRVWCEDWIDASGALADDARDGCDSEIHWGTEWNETCCAGLRSKVSPSIILRIR